MKTNIKNFTPIFTVISKSEYDISKIIRKNFYEDAIYEIRIDSLLKENYSISEIIYILNNITSIFSDTKFLFTIRTKEEGGLIDLKENYFDIWWEIYEKTTPNFIDIKYAVLASDKNALNKLENVIDYNYTKVITSYHSFKKDFNINETSDLIFNMMRSFGHIIKLAINIEKKDDLFMFLNFTHLLKDKLDELNKEAIFIVMGEMGKISRVWPEYSNSKYMYYCFNDSNNKKNKIGQINIDELHKYRELIGK